MPRLEFKDRNQLQSWVQAQSASLHRPAVVLLDGELGAGKTQTVRWFCAALGVRDVSSPTFAIHHEYASPGGPVDHVDLYRIKDDGDLENSGFWDLFKKPNALIFVEWASRLPDEIWPASFSLLRLRLTKGVEEEARILDWETEP